MQGAIFRDVQDVRYAENAGVIFRDVQEKVLTDLSTKLALRLQIQQ